MKNTTTKPLEIKTIKQAVLALRGDKHIQEKVFNLRLRFGIIDRPFTKDDFYLICKDENIRVFDDISLATCGFYFICRSKKYIAVSSRLKGRKLLFVAYHELGHAFLHNPLRNVHHFSNQPTIKSYVREAQANYFAELATEVKYEQIFG